MKQDKRIVRRMVLRGGAAIPATSLLAACGGGGGGEPSAILSAGETAPGAGSAPAPAPANISNLDASTYVIGLTLDVRGTKITVALGTGFAIEERLIATNAHVTQGVLDEARTLARQQIRVDKVSAFQSETGREFTLLRAATHPSYTGSSRSPDVGLFEVREAMPARLTLDAPEATTRLRKGDALQQNGFPGDIFRALYSNFQPGITVPRASLFSGTIQAIEHFDNRVVVDPERLSTIDMYQHSMDTSGGTSGSPILNGGRVVAVHNSGLQVRVQTVGPNGQPSAETVPIGTGSWGVNVKHLVNLVNFYRQGVLEADKSFSLPPSPQLLQSTATGGQSGTGQSADPTRGGAGSTFRGTVTNPQNPNVQHTIQLTVNSNLQLSGTSSWPAAPARNLPARTFNLSGRSDTSGRFEILDDTPERIPGFRRGVYLGLFNSASGAMVGEYYEFNQATNQLLYFGDWTASSR